MRTVEGQAKTLKMQMEKTEEHNGAHVEHWFEEQEVDEVEEGWVTWRWNDSWHIENIDHLPSCLWFDHRHDGG